MLIIAVSPAGVPGECVGESAPFERESRLLGGGPPCPSAEEAVSAANWYFLRIRRGCQCGE